MSLRLLTHAEQVAAHLRAELLRGRWKDELPGAPRLEAELDVNHTTISAALRLLENEGLLVLQGAGRRRRIVLPENAAPASQRIAILAYDPAGRNEAPGVDLLHHLTRPGRTVFFADKTLVELGMDVQRISRLVKKTEADAWIVISAPRMVLEWFVRQEAPAFALFFGGFGSLPIASIAPNYLPTMLEVTRRLVGLGHRRIVFVAGRGRGAKKPSRLWRAVFAELESHGIQTGAYNLPEWEDSQEGFQRFLNSLFEYTPPTAMVIEEVPHFVGTLNFCGQRGLRMPQDLSLACLIHHDNLSYCSPPVAHIRWDHGLLLRRIGRWADNVARGRDDRRQSYVIAEFVEGGTIGPAPSR